MITTKQRSLILFSVPFFILSIPLVAMQFTTEVKWELSDFIIMGGLLLLTVFTIDLVLKNFKTLKARLIIVSAILIALFLIWAELAVGIFGSPFAGSYKILLIF